MSVAVSSSTQSFLARASQHSGWEGKACRTLSEECKMEGLKERWLLPPTLFSSLIINFLHSIISIFKEVQNGQKGKAKLHIICKPKGHSKPRALSPELKICTGSKYVHLGCTTWDCLHCLPVDHYSSLVGQEIISRIGNFLREGGKKCYGKTDNIY